MKKLLKQIFTGLILLFILINYGWGYTGGYLELVTPLKGQTLGNSGSGILWGLDSLGINPAGLSGCERIEVNLGYLDYISDFKINKVGFVLPTQWGAFALDYSSFQSEKWEITTEEEPEGTGETFFEEDSCLTFGFSRRIFSDYLYAGFEIKRAQMKLYKYSSKTMLFSLGFRFYKDGFGLGLAFENIGGKVKFISAEENITSVFRVGLGLRVFQGKGGELFTLFDLEKKNELEPIFIPGFIYNYNDLINFNAGYRIDDGENGISTGLGFKINSGKNLIFTVDLIYSDVGILGEKNGAGISVGW
ncbi:MAG: hypothetical protein PHV06_06525 [bacterium]|nr:hypothetical protein [bacterium]